MPSWIVYDVTSADEVSTMLIDQTCCFICNVMSMLFCSGTSTVSGLIIRFYVIYDIMGGSSTQSVYVYQSVPIIYRRDCNARDLILTPQQFFL